MVAETEVDGVAGSKGWKQPLRLQVAWRRLAWAGTPGALSKSFTKI